MHGDRQEKVRLPAGSTSHGDVGSGQVQKTGQSRRGRERSSNHTLAEGARKADDAGDGDAYLDGTRSGRASSREQMREVCWWLLEIAEARTMGSRSRPGETGGTGTRVGLRRRWPNAAPQRLSQCQRRYGMRSHRCSRGDVSTEPQPHHVQDVIVVERDRMDPSQRGEVRKNRPKIHTEGQRTARNRFEALLASRAGRRGVWSRGRM